MCGTYNKLFDNTVLSVIGYGAGIWGHKKHSSICAIQNKAARFYLCVGKYTPNAAVLGDMAWTPVDILQWDHIIRQYRRLCKMNNNRINKRVFLWAEHGLKANWNHSVRKKLKDCDLEEHGNINNNIHTKNLVRLLREKQLEIYKIRWYTDINRISSQRGNGLNKLRTYKKFKTSYTVDAYVKCIMPRAHRSALAKFRSGTAPIRLETGRYVGLPVENRTCFNCVGNVETEEHVLLDCPLYDDLRREYVAALDINFDSFSRNDQLCFILSDEQTVRLSAKFCFYALRRRRTILYSNNL